MGLLDTPLSRLLCFKFTLQSPTFSTIFNTLTPHLPTTLTYFSLISPDDDCFLHKFLYICVLKQT